MQKQIIKAALYLSALLLIFSCQGKLSKKELQAYIVDADNGLLQKKQVRGLNVQWKYRPSDLVAQQMLDKSKPEEWDSLQTHFAKQSYFILSLSRGGQELLGSYTGAQAFGKMVSQLAFGMRQKVLMYYPGADTLNILDYHYPRMYGMSNSSDMLFAFEKIENKQKEIYLELQDLGYGTGKMRFIFQTKNIINTPKLDPFKP